MMNLKSRKMKRINSIGKLILVGIFAVLFTPSCTNLDEELYDVVSPEDFLRGEEQFVAYLGAAYTKLYGYAVGDLHQMQNSTSDQAMYPTRGSDWDDGGIHRRRSLHTWSIEDVDGTWNFAFQGVSDCNRLIETFQTLVDDGRVAEEQAAVFIGELAGIRALFYYFLIDTYGNVPIVTGFSQADPNPPTSSRAEVYNFLLDELAEWAPKLSKDVGGASYARMNYWAAKMIEAKLRLNAQVYTGTADWDGVIAVCDEIINSGKYSLESDFFTNFNLKSEVSKEFIFAIPYDKVFAQGFNLPMNTLHYGSQETYNLTQQPWNGYCTMEEFYNSFEDEDLRKGDPGTLAGPGVRRGTFLAGYQYKADKVTPVVDNGAEATDPDGTKLNFTPKVNSIGPNTLRQEGARIGKWEYEIGGTDNMGNDYGVFRYADVLLMKAEAIWRKTGNPTDAIALSLVNQVRITHGGTEIAPLTTLDGPISFKIEEGSQLGGALLAERGRELAFENIRRQDLIRWGVYTEVTKWVPPSGFPGEVGNSDPTRNIFPIPFNQLRANENLVQNPGYSSGG
jgi:starch-binding outer membrane protein, SusD/RagB family